MQGGDRTIVEIRERPEVVRVLHLLKTSTGAAWALRQVRVLAARGIEVHVALPPGGTLVQRYREAGAIVHPANFDFPIRHPWLWPGLATALRRLVQEIHPDLIHSHFFGTTLSMRLALGRDHTIPRVFQVPGPLHLEHAFFRTVELAMAGEHDYWLGSCRWTCDAYLHYGVPRDRIGLSYYGVDLGSFMPGEPGKLRRELGIPPETKVVGMVAYIYAPKRYLGQRRGLKGHEDLIDAVALRLGKGDDIVCVMVGGAWAGATEYEKRIRTYAARKCGSRVLLLGTRSDVSELYPDMDVVVHPSHSENVGGAAESLLLAVPTIASNVGGFPDLVRDRETGWLVPPRRPDLLAEALAEALGEPADAHMRALRGQSLARQLFDVADTAGTTHDYYLQILEQGAIRTAPSRS